jgi:[protein-PII] uridylyltransferase
MGALTQQQIDQFKGQRDALLRSVSEVSSGLEWCHRHTEWADAVIAKLFEALGGSDRSPISVVATGGYGRRELAPYSDIDLTVVPLDESAVEAEQLVSAFFRSLQESFRSFGLNLGYAFRLVNDADALDPESRTGWLDARLVAGSAEPFQRFLAQYRSTFPVGDFLIAKLKERERAFQKHHDTPLVVEPHLKEGAGGLRCFHCSNWLRIAMGDAPKMPTEAFETVLHVRNLLHSVAGKGIDRLSRQRQGEITELIGGNPSELVADTIRSMQSLHEEFLESKAALHENRFELAPGVVALRGEARIGASATLTDAAVGVALATQLGLHVESLPLAPSELGDGPKAVQALQRGEPTLRNLDKCGLLATLLPELESCRTLIPSDSVHTFTVFEHSLRVVRNLENISRNGLLAEIKEAFNAWHALILAALLHDVGKAVPGRPHSEEGAAMARKVCARFGMAKNDADLVVWLVENHLIFDRTMRFRDVMHPQTAVEFAEEVGSKERLDALTLLTYADVNAVSHQAWQPSQDALLQELYARTLHCLEADESPSSDPSLYRKRLMRELGRQDEDPEVIAQFIERMPAHYVVSTPPELVRLHIGYVRDAEHGKRTIEFDHRPEEGISEVTVCCPDQPRLLSKLLGTLYALDISVSGIRVSTTQGSPPVALDTFTVSFAHSALPPATARKLSAELESVLEGSKSIEDLLRAHGKDPERRQEHFSHAFVPGIPGILEIRAPRGRGMAYRLSRLIADQGWKVVSARVGQWAGRGAAAFYLVHENDGPIALEDVRGALERKV